MNKTIYIKDEDVAVWEKAKELAGEKLSPIIVDGLRRYVAENEAKVKGFERIELSYSDLDSNGLTRRKAFYGRWIFPPSKPLDLWHDEQEDADRYIVAVTAKGSVVICSWTEGPDSITWKRFKSFSSFEAAAADTLVNYAARKALEMVGVPIEELDI
jgi:hypothetical protein